MLAKISLFIEQHNLPKPPARLLVALSGGADSVALLLALQQLGYVLEAAHVNFHLRGEESDADEQFVRSFCKERGVSLHVAHFDTLREAAEQKESVEMTARRLRYAWFEQLLDATGCEAVAVAHHRNDNAETLLLNLCRGAGLRGLTGMKARNGRVVRPLLDVSRGEVVEYLQRVQQTFVVDSTNADTRYRRNFMRGEVLPLLQQVNPSIVDTLHSTAGRLQECEWLYNFAVNTLKDQCVHTRKDGLEINLTTLQTFPVATTLLHEWLSPLGFSTETIAKILQDGWRQGARFDAEEYVAVVHRGRLEVRFRPVKIEPISLPLEGSRLLSDGTQLELTVMDRSELEAIPRSSNTACLDLDRVQGTLQVRSVQTGDRFRPFGMRGTRLVSDFLTDRHRSMIDKMVAKVVTDDQGILWLAGERPDARGAVGEDTRRVLLIVMKDRT